MSPEELLIVGMDILSESIQNGAPYMDFEMCKNGWSGPEYNHLDREQPAKLEYSVEIKPGGTWTVGIKRGIVQGDSLSPLLFVIIMIDTTVTDYKGYQSCLPTR